MASLLIVRRWQLSKVTQYNKHATQREASYLFEYHYLLLCVHIPHIPIPWQYTNNYSLNNEAIGG